VVNPDNRLSNAIAVPIAKPTVALNIFSWWQPLITREVQLLLLVVFAGALGSYVHAIKSLADFIGNRTLTESWFWWYFTRPFLGMSMALIFYAVLRGGFLAATPGDAKVVNPFGVIAIAALVGMFSDKAAQKLGEIFDTLFKSEDPRSGHLAAPVIDKIDPDIVQAGATAPILLKISGDRLGKVSGVRLNADERKPETVSEKEVTIRLRPEDLATPRQIAVTAVNPDGTVSAAQTLRITDLTLVTATLHPAQVSAAYQAELQASGGAAPYKWSLMSAPAWLKINEDTGALTGTPTTPGDAKIAIKVVDNVATNVSKTFDLRVNP
jgi:Putative Ig domain